MLNEEIVINNSTLYKDGKPYFYREISLSDITLHKLAGYNGQLHNYAQSIIEADNMLRFSGFKKDLSVLKSKNHSLADALYLLNRKNSLINILFKHRSINIINQIKSQLAARFTDPEYISIVPDFRKINSSNDIWAEIPENAFIFLATMNNYLNPMIPVMDELIVQGKPVVLLTVARLSEYPNFCKINTKVKIVFLEDLVDAQLENRFDSYLKSADAEWENAKKKHKENVKHASINFFELIERSYMEMYLTYIPHIKLFIDIAYKISEKKPKCLIIARLRRETEISFNEVFRKLKIPTYMLIHGHISDEDSRYFADGYFDRVDKIFVWYEWQKYLLLNKNYEHVVENKIVITGNPAWEQLRKRVNNDDFISLNEIKKILKIQRDYILLITQNGLPVSGYIKAVDAIVNHGKFDVVIKIHPEEKKNRYTFTDQKNIHIIDNGVEVDLHSLIKRAVFTLVHSSTVNLEIIEVGKKPVILDFLDFRDFPLLLNFDRNNVLWARDEKELIDIFNSEVPDIEVTSPDIKSVDLICEIIGV